MTPRPLLAALCAAALLAACDDGGRGARRADLELATEAAPPPAKEAVTVMGSRLRAEGDAADGAETPVAADLLLAYVYGAALEAPADAVAGLMEGHAAACRAAGPRTCLVFGSEATAQGDWTSAYLNIRAEPGWLAEFRAGLEGDAEEAGGRLVSTSMNAEDLTTQIVDTEARLKALRTLRDRLEAILETKPSDVKALLEVERELARVQGQLDAAQSRLAVMRQRVDMSILNLRYETKRTAVNRGVFSPLVDAVRDALRVFIESVATVITIVVAAIPFLVIGAPILWGIFRFIFRRRKAS